jgi:hypothetical protein
MLSGLPSLFRIAGRFEGDRTPEAPGARERLTRRAHLAGRRTRQIVLKIRRVAQVSAPLPDSTKLITGETWGGALHLETASYPPTGHFDSRRAQWQITIHGPDH